MEALCEQLEREAIHKVIEKLQEDDLGIVVSIEHDGVVVRHPDGAAAVTAEWKAGLVKAAEMAIKECRSPDKILNAGPGRIPRPWR